MRHSWFYGTHLAAVWNASVSASVSIMKALCTSLQMAHQRVNGMWKRNFSFLLHEPRVTPEITDSGVAKMPRVLCTGRQSQGRRVRQFRFTREDQPISVVFHVAARIWPVCRTPGKLFCLFLPLAVWRSGSETTLIAVTDGGADRPIASDRSIH